MPDKTAKTDTTPKKKRDIPLEKELELVAEEVANRLALMAETYVKNNRFCEAGYCDTLSGVAAALANGLRQLPRD